MVRATSNRHVAIGGQSKGAQLLVLLIAPTTFFFGRLSRYPVCMLECRRALLHGQGLPEPAYHGNHPQGFPYIW